MKHFVTKITLTIGAFGCFILSCSKKKDATPSETCNQQSEWQNGVKGDSFAYNGSNQLITIFEYDSTGKQASVAGITYNNNGTIAQFTIAYSGADSSESMKNYYNSSGQLNYQLVYSIIGVTTTKTDSIVYQYTGNNITTEIDYSVGVNASPSVSFSSVYTYDGNGNVLTEKDTYTGGYDMYTYTYDTEKIPYGTLITNAYTSTGDGIDMAYLNGKNNLTSMVYTVNSVTQPGNFTTSYSYNSYGYPVATTDNYSGQIYSSSYNYVCK